MKKKKPQGRLTDEQVKKLKAALSSQEVLDKLITLDKNVDLLQEVYLKPKESIWQRIKKKFKRKVKNES